MGWATDEFSEIDLGDKRLDSRLIKLCESFSQSPESPINQACADWAETKAAYRFFKNKNVNVEKIMSAHRQKIFPRKLHPEHERRTAEERNIQDVLPVEEKESYRWI